MILRSYYSETPKPLAWGNKFIVPLNAEEVTQLDAEGNETKVYLADVIENVEKLNVSSIVKAAVAAKFTPEEVDYVMLNVGNTDDEKVNAYSKFVASITEQAKAAGYTD